MTDVRNMRKIMETVETVEEGRYATNIPVYIKNEANDLAISISELEAVAEFAREEGSDATAGSIDSAINLMSKAIRALERAEREVGTSLDDADDDFDDPSDWDDMSDNMRQLARQGR